jgi:putative transposase
MTIDPRLVDELLAGYKKPEDIIGENGLLKQLTKALLERAMNAELTEHVGYEKHDPAGYNSGNSRNGATKKKLKGDFGEMELETPRDRNGSFEPAIVSKGQTRFAVGALGAFGTSRLIQEMLFGVTLADPLTFTLAAWLMVSVAVVAALFPAYRALKTDPMIALRAE